MLSLTGQVDDGQEKFSEKGGKTKVGMEANFWLCAFCSLLDITSKSTPMDVKGSVLVFEQKKVGKRGEKINSGRRTQTTNGELKCYFCGSSLLTLSRVPYHIPNTVVT